ncbi:MAG: hypothetical protein Q9224_002269, partial [Gallowayella concinna]
MEGLSSPAQLPSLSQTSPINDVTNTETISSSSNNPPRTRKHNKYDTPSRQAAKREILANVKEDWTWPPSADQLGNKFPRRRKSTQWRERESESSPARSRSLSSSDTNSYNYESPGVVGPTAPDRRENKRRRLMDHETQWNEGLRIFLERRDFWTGAESQPITSNEGDGEPPVDDTSDSEPAIPQPQPLSASASSTTLNTHPASPTSISTQSLATSITSQPSSTPPSTRTSQSSEVLPP